MNREKSLSYLYIVVWHDPEGIHDKGFDTYEEAEKFYKKVKYSYGGYANLYQQMRFKI